MTSHGLKIMPDHCITPVLYHQTLRKTTSSDAKASRTQSLGTYLKWYEIWHKIFL